MYSKFKIKNSLRRVTFGLINFVDSRLYKNSNKVKLIQELCKNVTVLKPEILKTILTFIYKKIQSHNNEPTTIQIKSLQSFLRTQLQRNEITKA